MRDDLSALDWAKLVVAIVAVFAPILAAGIPFVHMVWTFWAELLL